MNDSINWIAIIILAAIIYVMLSSLYHYIQMTKHTCGLCMGTKRVSKCCGEPLKYVPNPSDKSKNMQVCTECGRYCKSVTCEGKH